MWKRETHNWKVNHLNKPAHRSESNDNTMGGNRMDMKM